MNDNFDEIKKTWYLANNSVDSNYKKLEEAIAHMKSLRKKRIFFMSFIAIIFSVFVIAYVIYTDELNSVYKSSSEFVLLFTAFYFFWYSWKNISNQKKEYLLRTIDFLNNLSKEETNRLHKKVITNCICFSLCILSVLLYFLDDVFHSQGLFFLSICFYLIFLFVLWFIVKPLYIKMKMKKNEKTLMQLNKIIININTEKL